MLLVWRLQDGHLLSLWHRIEKQATLKSEAADFGILASHHWHHIISYHIIYLQIGRHGVFASLNSFGARENQAWIWSLRVEGQARSTQRLGRILHLLILLLLLRLGRNHGQRSNDQAVEAQAGRTCPCRDQCKRQGGPARRHFCCANLFPTIMTQIAATGT